MHFLPQSFPFQHKNAWEAALQANEFRRRIDGTEGVEIIPEEENIPKHYPSNDESFMTIIVRVQIYGKPEERQHTAERLNETYKDLIEEQKEKKEENQGQSPSYGSAPSDDFDPFLDSDDLP